MAAIDCTDLTKTDGRAGRGNGRPRGGGATASGIGCAGGSRRLAVPRERPL